MSKEVDDNLDNPISFPSEVLGHVIELLSLQDRKNARLVCRFWHECASSWSVIKCEKFVFRSNCNEREVIEILQSNFVRPNLEFRNFSIEDSSLSTQFWKTCGPKIQSLYFYNCKWNDKIVYDVIFHCVNLSSLTIEYYDRHNIQEWKLGALGTGLIYLLDDLIKIGVKRTKLESLALPIKRFTFDLVAAESLGKFASIYPCMKYFRLSSNNYEDKPGFPFKVDPITGNESLFEGKFEYLTHLTFNYCVTGSWMEHVLKSTLKLRLTEFETTLWKFSLSMESTILSFFKEQYNMKRLKLSVSGFESVFYKILLFYCLENCPNLRDFMFDTLFDCIELSDEEIPLLFPLIKNLKSFYFIPNYSGSITTPPRPDIPINFSLTTLDLGDFGFEFREILKYCPLLKRLKVGSPCEETLQIIFQYLLKLETLVLEGLNIYNPYNAYLGTSSGATPRLSISRLQELKNLELSCGLHCNTIYDQFHRSTVESIIPVLQNFSSSLECLSLRVCFFDVPSAGSVLTQVTSNISAVTSLTIPYTSVLYGNDHSVYRRKVVEFCKRLRNLYHLKIDCTEEVFTTIFDEGEVMRLFQACPYLRYVSNRHSPYPQIPYNITFSFDPMTNKVVKFEDISLTIEKFFDLF